MSVGTLWTVPATQPQTNFIRAAAAIGGIQIDIPEAFDYKEELKKPEYLAKFPHGKIPIWEGRDGFLLTESHAIGRYIASLAPNSGLLGTSPQEAALVDQWSYFAATELVPYLGSIFQLVYGFFTPYFKPIHQIWHEQALRSYKTLNTVLASRTFLVGDRLTLADLVVASALKMAFAANFDAQLRAELPHVVRFFKTVINQPKVKEFFGEIQYVEKAIQYVPPPKEKKAEKKAEK